MMKPKKRLSGCLGLNADGVDPQFEFDVPRLFADLTQPPRYAKAPGSDHLLAHDAWFDLVHESHSRPTDEFLAAQAAERAQQSEPLAAPRALHHASDPDGEKENSGARPKRRNVAYSAKADAAPVATVKATMRTVSKAVAATKKAPAKLPFGNSASATPAAKSKPHASGAHTLPRKRPAAPEAANARSRTLPVGQRKNAPVAGAAAKDLQDLQALLAKHNKKFKATHTYEPRQHSVRDVRLWEKHTQKSYYKLSLEDRFQANNEIAQLIRDREENAVQ